MSSADQQHLAPSTQEQDPRLSLEADETEFSLDAKTLTELVVSNTVGLNFNLNTPSGEQVYFAETTPLKSGSSLLLRKGSAKGAVVAASKFHMTGDDEIALGDPTAGGTEWTSLSKKGFFTKVPRSFSLPNDPSKKFTWKKTKTLPDLPGLEDVKMTKLTMFHMKLVEEAAGEVLAAFVSRPIGNLATQGTLYVKNGQGEEWELMAIISAMTIIEKRKRATGASGGAHV